MSTPRLDAYTSIVQRATGGLPREIARYIAEIITGNVIITRMRTVLSGIRLPVINLFHTPGNYWNPPTWELDHHMEPYDPNVGRRAIATYRHNRAPRRRDFTRRGLYRHLGDRDPDDTYNSGFVSGITGYAQMDHPNP